MVLFYLNEPKRCNKLHPTTPYLRPKERLKAQMKQASFNVRKESLKCVYEFKDTMNDGLSDAMDCNQYFESVGATMSHKKRVTRSHLQVADFFSSLKLTLSFGTGKTSERMVFGFIEKIELIGGVF